jgi:predicted nucleotidyltransferase
MLLPTFLTGNIRDELEKIRSRFDLHFIILHGSYAKGTVHSGSDFDIAVVGKRPIGFTEIMEIQSNFGQLFETVGINNLDVKPLDRVDALFRYLVVRDSILLAGNLHDYNEFKAYAFRAFIDTADLRILERRMIQAKQNMLSTRYA